MKKKIQKPFNVEEAKKWCYSISWKKKTTSGTQILSHYQKSKKVER